MEEAIRVTDLRVVYPGGVNALKGLSFAVKKQEIVGLLGPNGAGKTTTINVLTTLIKPTGGEALVNGYQVSRQQNKIRMSLGYVSQDLAVDDELNGRDNLWLQASLYNIRGKLKKERIREVLELVNLTERAGDMVDTYSGGMKKRLDIACGLVHRPDILFLDEPTLGLDIQTRHEIWDYIARLRREEKMTLLITSHYMDEVDRLCDRIAIIDQGELVIMDTPANLKKGLGGDIISFSFGADISPERVKTALAGMEQLPGLSSLTRENGSYRAVVPSGEEAMPFFFQALDGLPLKNITMKKPSLDDVFLHYTGRAMREEKGNLEDSRRNRSTLSRIRGRR